MSKAIRLMDDRAPGTLRSREESGIRAMAAILNSSSACSVGLPRQLFAAICLTDRLAHMKTLTKEIWMNVPQRRAIVSIHEEVERLVGASGVKEGLVLVCAMHITASVFINDNESGLHHDYEVWLEQLAPFDPSPQRYHHNRTGEDNADAHLKRQVMGREVVLAITDGKLHLGPWEHIFYYEFDGKRRKRVLVKIIGE